MFAAGSGAAVVPGHAGPLDAAVGADLVVFLLVGLLGGAHCLGMCGPLVTLYADRVDRGGPLAWVEVRQQLLFNLGRTGAYAAVGALLGGLGAAVFDAAGTFAVADAVRATVGVLVGAFVLLTGASYLLRGTAVTGHGGGPVGDVFGRIYGAITGRVDRWVRGPRIVGLGALHALLPCPLLYPGYLYVFAAGSPVRGAVLMGTLGLGTLPTMLAYGTVVTGVGAGTRARLHRALGVAMLALGYLPLAMGLGALGVDLPAPPVPYYQPLG